MNESAPARRDSDAPDVAVPLPPYRAPAWLAGSHLQTIYPQFLPRPPIAFRREVVESADGDFWDFDWMDGHQGGATPLVVLFHGLEGGSGSAYARELMVALARIGWRGVIPHFRGCGGAPNRLPRAYHSGDYADVAAMLAAIDARERARFGDHPPPRCAVGVSLGGSALLNWLGREGSHAAKQIKAAAAISTPLDLMAAGKSIDRGLNRIYARHFLSTLVPKGVALAKRHPGVLELSRVRAVRTMWAFDDTVTAPMHGFAGAADYYTRASSKPWLKSVAIPTLVLNARNDPFIPAWSLPGEGEVSREVHLEQPAHGGHGAFPAGPFPGNVRWLPRRLLQFFRTGV